MRFNTIFIFVFFLQFPLFGGEVASKGCETNDKVCLKKMAQENIENRDSETYLKITMVNCLYNEECSDLFQGIPESIYRDVDSPDIYKAINNFLKTEMPILRQGKLKNDELIRRSQKDHEIILELEETIIKNQKEKKSLEDSLRRISFSKNKFDSIKEENQKLIEKQEMEIKELQENIQKLIEKQKMEIKGLQENNQELIVENLDLKRTHLNPPTTTLKSDNETEKAKSAEASQIIDKNVPQFFIVNPAAKSFYDYAKGNIGQLLIISIGLILVLILLTALLIFYIWQYLRSKKFIEKSGGIDDDFDGFKK